MTTEEIRQAYANLMSCHMKIRQKFAHIKDHDLERFLGASDSACLREQVRMYGDGYTLRSVPDHVKDISATEEVVLIVGRFPWLGMKSRFNPHEPLIEIPYWGEKLRPTIAMPDGGERQCRFLIWQNCYPVHGNSRDRPRSNQEFLSDVLSKPPPSFDELVQSQIEESKRLLMAWADWLREGNPRRQLILVTDPCDPICRSQIPEITRKTRVHVPAHLWKSCGAPEHNLMDLIEEHISNNLDL